MKSITTKNLSEGLNWRYATKKFDPTQIISDSTAQALREALVLTPSYIDLQP